MLNFFADRVWSPVGSRPHILLVGSPQLAAYAVSINAQSRDWWERQPESENRRWEDVVQEVPSHYLHLTLTWLDRLTAEVDEDDLSRLRIELQKRFATLPPAEVHIGKPVVEEYALELYVYPTPSVNAIAAQARAAVRSVFGEKAAPEPPMNKPWRPHVTTFYGSDSFDSLELAEVLRRNAETVEHSAALKFPAQAIFVDQDTFRKEGFWWNADTAQFISIGEKSVE